MPRTTNPLSPSTVPSVSRLPGVMPFRKFFRRDQRIGLREEHERVVNHRIIAALQVVIAEAAIAGHIDPENEQVALAFDPRVNDRFDHGDRHANGLRSLNLVQNRLVETGLAGAHLQFRLPGDPIDCAREREEHALIRGVHADEHRHPEYDPGDRQQCSQHVLSEVRPADQPDEDHGVTRALPARCGRPRRPGRREA
jgi:hypothetical protein